MDKKRKIRIAFDKNQLSVIEASLKEYISYSKEKGYKQSIERMNPILEYIE